MDSLARGLWELSWAVRMQVVHAVTGLGVFRVAHIAGPSYLSATTDRFGDVSLPQWVWTILSRDVPAGGVVYGDRALYDALVLHRGEG
jgi:hypothetical protein